MQGDKTKIHEFHVLIFPALLPFNPINGNDCINIILLKKGKMVVKVCLETMIEGNYKFVT